MAFPGALPAATKAVSDKSRRRARRPAARRKPARTCARSASASAGRRRRGPGDDRDSRRSGSDMKTETANARKRSASCRICTAIILVLSDPPESCRSCNTLRTLLRRRPSSRPGGVRGCTAPKARHWCGFFTPCKICPPMQSGDSSAWNWPRRSAARRRSGELRAQAVAAGGITPMPRQSRSQTSKTWLSRRCAGWLPSRFTARAYWFSTPGGLLPAPDRHVDALQHVQRLEAGDDDRHAILRRHRLVFPVAHHRADVARGQEALHAVARRAQDGFHGRRHQHVRAQDREVLQPRCWPARRPSRCRAPWSRSRRRRRRPVGQGRLASLTASSGE